MKNLCAAINAIPAARGLLLREGTLVDAMRIAAPPSTKKEAWQRDPEMLQIKKGNQWYFGMESPLGADWDSKRAHTVVVTVAKVADITKTTELLHGQEHQVHTDTGCAGAQKRAEFVALKRKLDWQIAGKCGTIKKSAAEGAEKKTHDNRESRSLGEIVRTTPLPHSQESIPASESAGSRTAQERPSTLHTFRTRQRGDQRPHRQGITGMKHHETNRLKR